MSAVLSCTENIDLNLSFTSSSWPRLELQCCNSSPITQLIPLLNSPARNPPSETPVGLLHCSLRPPVKSWFKLRRCNTSYTCPTRATGGIAGLFFFCLLGQFGTGIGVRYSMMGTRMEKGTIGLGPTWVAPSLRYKVSHALMMPPPEQCSVNTKLCALLPDMNGRIPLVRLRSLVGSPMSLRQFSPPGSSWSCSRVAIPSVRKSDTTPCASVEEVLSTALTFLASIDSFCLTLDFPSFGRIRPPSPLASRAKWPFRPSRHPTCPLHVRDRALHTLCIDQDISMSEIEADHLQRKALQILPG